MYLQRLWAKLLICTSDSSFFGTGPHKELNPYNTDTSFLKCLPPYPCISGTSLRLYSFFLVWFSLICFFFTLFYQSLLSLCICIQFLSFSCFVRWSYRRHWVAFLYLFLRFCSFFDQFSLWLQDTFSIQLFQSAYAMSQHWFIPWGTLFLSAGSCIDDGRVGQLCLVCITSHRVSEELWSGLHLRLRPGKDQKTIYKC